MSDFRLAETFCGRMEPPQFVIMILSLFRVREVMLLLVALLLARSVFGGQLISSRSDGSALNGASSEPSISGDGRFVVFSTLAALNASDANGKSDVFLKDREAGTLRRISNELGGDQPMISANGRYVVFRALDTFPKIRFVDLESNEPARTVSYPFNGNSFRYADSATISPDGAFVAFSFRPIPGFNNNTNPLLSVISTFNPNRLNAGDTAPQSFNLNTLARSSMTRDGGKFFFETRDALLPADTNGVVDIYMATPNDNFVVRLSATESGLPETGAAYDPMVTPDGSTVFFISNRRLRVSDNDGRATIYRSTSGDNFATPQPLLMSVQPVSISPQAASNGQFLVFLGRSASGVLRPYVWRAGDGAVREIASAATASTGEPSISADNGDIVFASRNSFAGGDQNGVSDVYLVQNPFAGARIAKPVATLAGVSNGAVITEGNGVNLTGTASGGGGILFTALEVDGVEVQRGNGGAVNRFTVLSGGVHTIRATALSLANVPGQSASVQVTVVPAANTLHITGPRGLTRLPQGDGSTVFTASVRIDNTFGTASGALQILVVEIPNAAQWEFFGNTDNVTPEPERIVGLLDVSSLPAGGANVSSLSERVSPPTVIGDGFQGGGSTVVARLREFAGGAWVVRDQIDLLAIRPALNEETPGPNGGIPLLTSNTGTSNFTPAVFQGVQVQGSPTIVERSSITYNALAIYSNGNQPCRPEWSIVNGAAGASISALGILSVGDVSAPVTITLRASFGGRTAAIPVTITPISPVISVIAVAPLATESGTQGAFKILRTPVENTPLTVNYRVAGNAIAGQDYTALSGTVIIPAGVASARIQVVPLDDAFFEGRERVVLSVLPSAKYRRNASSAGTVVIEDNEPGQPDAMIRASGGAEIGAFQFEFNFPGSEQRAFLRAVSGTPSAFVCRFVNRGSAVENFTLSGGSDILGCSVRYFFGASDVTAQVVGGSFTLNNVQPGGQITLLVRLTTSAATPLGAVIRCPVRLDGNAGSDTVEAMVRRVR